MCLGDTAIDIMLEMQTAPVICKNTFLEFEDRPSIPSVRKTRSESPARGRGSVFSLESLTTASHSRDLSCDSVPSTNWDLVDDSESHQGQIAGRGRLLRARSRSPTTKENDGVAAAASAAFAAAAASVTAAKAAANAATSAAAAAAAAGLSSEHPLRSRVVSESISPAIDTDAHPRSLSEMVRPPGTFHVDHTHLSRSVQPFNSQCGASPPAFGTAVQPCVESGACQPLAMLCFVPFMVQPTVMQSSVPAVASRERGGRKASKRADLRTAPFGSDSEDAAMVEWERSIGIFRPSRKSTPAAPSEQTTVMLRNVPTTFSEERMLHEMHVRGFRETYDFFYLPTDATSTCNRGYCIVNFCCAKNARQFMTAFQKLSLDPYTGKACKVTFAKHQGKEANLELQRN